MDCVRFDLIRFDSADSFLPSLTFETKPQGKPTVHSVPRMATGVPVFPPARTLAFHDGCFAESGKNRSFGGEAEADAAGEASSGAVALECPSRSFPEEYFRCGPRLSSMESVDTLHQALAGIALAVAIAVALVVAFLPEKRRWRWLQGQKKQKLRRQEEGRHTEPNSRGEGTRCRSIDASGDPRTAAKKEFLSRAGDDYGYGGSQLGHIDGWRPREFPALQTPIGHSEQRTQGREGGIADGHSDCESSKSHNDNGTAFEREVYLDYAGAALPSRSQLERAFAAASAGPVLANPHSSGPAASRASEDIEKSRRRVLEHLGASPGRYASLRLPEGPRSGQDISPQPPSAMDVHPGYEVLFTPGATEAFRTVAERFPWRPGGVDRGGGGGGNEEKRSIFAFVSNSHNSVVGMRAVALRKGAAFCCLTPEELQQLTSVGDFERLEDRVLENHSVEKKCQNNNDNDKPHNTNGPRKGCGRHGMREHRRHLLVFPSECNFGGDRPDAKSILAAARKSGWHTMLDIAKHAATDEVRLNQLDPDFAALSFYKLFGHPTGLGALLVRRPSVEVLLEASTVGGGHYQGGGSVDLVLPFRGYTVPKPGLASLASGTCHFRGIADLSHGFDALERLGGMPAVHRHAVSLAGELARRLSEMRHANGRMVVRIYGAWAGRGGEHRQNNGIGPTVALNVVRSDGSPVGYSEVSKLASLHRPPIQLRTGCFCNPGACQRALGVGEETALEHYRTTGHVCGDHIDLDGGTPTGAVRVSFGKDSLWEDMDVFVRFLETTFRNHNPETSPVVTGGNAPGHCEPKSGPEESKVSVSELYLFPIKSCAAQRAPKWPLVLPSGKLRYDREFALVDRSGTVLRLQKHPKLGLVSPVVDLEAGTMTVSAPGCEDLVVGLSETLYHGGENAVRVCGDTCGGRVWGDASVSDWFASFLGIECWLARYDSSLATDRVIKDRPGFSNEQPILLVSESAVATLNGVLSEQDQPPCTAKRFRANIVVKGHTTRGGHPASDRCHGHAEDEWKTVRLSRNHRLEFSVEGDCPRCAMVDYDPETGQKGKTLRALASYRRRNNGRIVFGIFLRASEGILPDTSSLGAGNGDRGEEGSDAGTIWIREGDTLECKR
ncbi:unnamed protein product [Pseudo-nitzschia multistriata]|uniref:MOSC domain-containing protein n=1 Tax=Pseudo-nitzschia multistriata TaxID=183589 RepID=A0A448YXB4_9STRA|nr:unnamed protein product [Pseudo-nitzschia multistriata]